MVLPHRGSLHGEYVMSQARLLSENVSLCVPLQLQKNLLGREGGPESPTFSPVQLRGLPPARFNQPLPAEPSAY